MAHNKLADHLPLVQKMLEKVRNTDAETKWQHLLNLINAAERLSDEKILQIDEVIKSVRDKLLNYQNKNDEEEGSTSHQSAPTNIMEEAPPQIKDKPAVKKKKKRKDQTRKLVIKLPSMASPARERIPKLKVSLSEIYRLKRLKRERKKKKRLRLFVTMRGQSLKREMMTPAHNAPLVEPPVEATPINEIPINEIPINETPINEVPINEIPINETPINEPNLNNEELGTVQNVETKLDPIEKYNLKKCKVVVERINENSIIIEPLNYQTIIIQPAKDLPFLMNGLSENPEIGAPNLTEPSTSRTLCQNSTSLTKPILDQSILNGESPQSAKTAPNSIETLSKPTPLLRERSTRINSQSSVQKLQIPSKQTLSNNSVVATLKEPVIVKKSPRIITRNSTPKSLPEAPKEIPPKQIEKPRTPSLPVAKKSNPLSVQMNSIIRNSTPSKADDGGMNPLIKDCLQSILESIPPPSKRIKISNVQTISKMEIKESPQEAAGSKSPPMITIPSELLSSSNVLLNADLTMEKLRPWLKKSDHQKQSNICDEMLNSDYCMAALFKCMASTCGYYTCSSLLFNQHMRLHWYNQPQDRKNYSQCSYCNFKSEECMNLIQHIINEHGATRYQCPYCFYRSYDYHIVAHIKMFHPLKPESTIKCNPTKSLLIKLELCLVWKEFFKTCRTILCVVCKERFLNLSQFQTHFNTHTVIPSQCRKCLLEVNKETIMTHLKGCHGFGNLNCAYCTFGSDSTELLKNHLANEHANKFMLFFDRVNLPTQTTSNDVSKQLALKQFEVQLSKKWNIIAYSLKLLQNATNVRKGLECYGVKTEKDITPNIIEIV